MLGYIVSTVDDGEPKNGFVVDFVVGEFAGRAGVADVLVGGAIRCLRARGASSAQLMAMDGPYQEALVRHGFVELPLSMSSAHRLIGRAAAGHDSPPCFKSGTKWFLTRGDADTDMVMR